MFIQRIQILQVFFSYSGNSIHVLKKNTGPLYLAYINVINRDILHIPLQMFINYTPVQFTLKCIFSHKGFLFMVFIQLENTEKWECANRTSQKDTNHPLSSSCGNNVNIYRSGKLTGVLISKSRAILCADAISCFDLNIHQLGAVAPRRLNPISHLYLSQICGRVFCKNCSREGMELQSLTRVCSTWQKRHLNVDPRRRWLLVFRHCCEVAQVKLSLVWGSQRCSQMEFSSVPRPWKPSSFAKLFYVEGGQGFMRSESMLITQKRRFQ